MCVSVAHNKHLDYHVIVSNESKAVNEITVIILLETISQYNISYFVIIVLLAIYCTLENFPTILLVDTPGYSFYQDIRHFIFANTTTQRQGKLGIQIVKTPL